MSKVERASCASVIAQRSRHRPRLLPRNERRCCNEGRPSADSFGFQTGGTLPRSAAKYAKFAPVNQLGIAACNALPACCGLMGRRLGGPATTKAARTYTSRLAKRLVPNGEF